MLTISYAKRQDFVQTFSGTFQSKTINFNDQNFDIISISNNTISMEDEIFHSNSVSHLLTEGLYLNLHNVGLKKLSLIKYLAMIQKV